MDIQGEWNAALLENAAALSGCACHFATSTPAAREDTARRGANGDLALEEALQGFRRVIACETTKNSRSVYELPAPRERTAVLVGNEEEGLPRAVLKRADSIVSVPMATSALSSINVAVAAAIALYALTRDLGRRNPPRRRLRVRDVDVLIEAPADPHELGSLLRSAYGFGWRRVFLSDPHRVWFTDNPRVILDGRAAARRAKNLLSVRPAEELEPADYDAALVCDPDGEGEPLSRLRLPNCARLLLVFGGTGVHGALPVPGSPVRVDYVDGRAAARPRHSGSIFLSVTASLLAS